MSLSVSLQLQQLGLQAQWTARYSLGGFSSGQPWIQASVSQAKESKKKPKMKSTAISVSNQCSNQSIETTVKPTVAIKRYLWTTPIEAYHHQCSDSTPTAIVPITLPSPESYMLPPTSESAHESPDLTNT